MALLDFLKKKEDIEKAKKPEKAEKSLATEKKGAKKETKKKEPKEVKQVAVKKGFSFEALKSLHISEKANNLSAIDQYVFEVNDLANKTEIARAIEGMYKVNVLSVNLIRIPKKKRRLGRIEGYKKGYKKAVVKIKQGQKIETI